MNKYEIKIDGIWINHQAVRKKNGYTLLNDPDEELEYAVIAPKVSLELGTAGSLEFTLPPNHPAYTGYISDSISSEEDTEQTRWTSSTITLQEEGDYIFAGRVYSWKIDMFKRKTICCEGALSFLHDSVQPYAVYDNVALESFVTTLLTYHNMQVEENRKIHPGYLTQLGGPAVYRVTSWESTWDALQNYVLDTNGGYFIIRTTSPKKGHFTHYLDYYSPTNILFSENAGQRKLYNKQVIEFGENLLDISESFAMDDVVTQVLPLGATIMADQILRELGFADDQDNAVVFALGAVVRKDAGDDYQPVNNYAGLTVGTVITVDGIKKDINGAVWYHVNYKVKITGFVYAAHTDKADEWDALGEGSYGSAQVTVDSTPVRMGASSSFPQVADYDPEDATDESTYYLGQTFSVKGVYMDINGTGEKWFAVEFSEKNPSGYIKQMFIEPTNGYSEGATVIRGMSIVPIATVTVSGKSTKLRTGPGSNFPQVEGSKTLRYGDHVDVCDNDITNDYENIKYLVWMYCKDTRGNYGYIPYDKLDVPENVFRSCPNDTFRKTKEQIIHNNGVVGVPGFYTDHWAQSLSLTTDNRRTIAARNYGRIVMTIQDAIAYEKDYVAENGELLDGTPIFTGSQNSGYDGISDPVDIGGSPVDEELFTSATKIRTTADGSDVYFNAGDNTALDRFGLITKVVEFNDCKTADELMHKAAKYLLNHIRYPVEISCSSADLHYFNLNWPAFKIGQFVAVKFPGWRSEYSWGSTPYFTENGSILRILKLEIEIDTGKKSIAIGTVKKKDLTEITKEIKDEAERDKNKIKVMNIEDYEMLPYKDDGKIYFCVGDT